MQRRGDSVEKDEQAFAARLGVATMVALKSWVAGGHQVVKLWIFAWHQVSCLSSCDEFNSCSRRSQTDAVGDVPLERQVTKGGPKEV